MISAFKFSDIRVNHDLSCFTRGGRSEERKARFILSCPFIIIDKVISFMSEDFTLLLCCFNMDLSKNSLKGFHLFKLLM